MSERMSRVPKKMQKVEGPKEPVDIRLANKGKGLGILQAGVGLGVGTFINPVLGAGMIVYEGAQWVAIDKYVRWRRKNVMQASSKQQLQKAA